MRHLLGPVALLVSAVGFTCNYIQSLAFDAVDAQTALRTFGTVCTTYNGLVQLNNGICLNVPAPDTCPYWSGPCPANNCPQVCDVPLTSGAVMQSHTHEYHQINPVNCPQVNKTECQAGFFFGCSCSVTAAMYACPGTYTKNVNGSCS